MRPTMFFQAAGIAIIAFALSYGCYKMAGDFFHTTISHQWFSKHQKLNYATFNQAFSLKNVNTVEVMVDNTNIYIRHTNQPEGKIEFTTGVDQQRAIAIDKQNQSLSIKINNLSDYSDASLIISVPENVKVIKIDSKTGDINIEHLDVNNLSINGISGDIILDDVNIADASITTVDGDLHWIGSGKAAVIKSVSGDIFVSSSFSSLNDDIKTVSGDVNIVLAKPVNAQLDMQSVSGEVSTSNSISLSGKGGLIKIRSVSGDIQVDGK